jgi:hypothetical protein
MAHRLIRATSCRRSSPENPLAHRRPAPIGQEAQLVTDPCASPGFSIRRCPMGYGFVRVPFEITPRRVRHLQPTARYDALAGSSSSSRKATRSAAVRSESGCGEGACIFADESLVGAPLSIDARLLFRLLQLLCVPCHLKACQQLDITSCAVNARFPGTSHLAVDPN